MGEMALVNYSDSDRSEAEDDTSKNPSQVKTLKRKRTASFNSELPPLPDAFHDLYASTTRVSSQDDPILHGGRQRVTPHVEGNWPTHVYIEWYPSRAESDKLTSLLSSLHGDSSAKDSPIHSLLQSELGAETPLHISLSRSIMLRTDQRQRFIDTLKAFISKSGIRPFKLSVRGLEWVPNHERTRWFLVLKLGKPSENSLNKLLQLSNMTANAFGQPSLYAPSSQHPTAGSSGGSIQRGRGLPRPDLLTSMSKYPEGVNDEVHLDQSAHFHISIAWSLERPNLELIERLKSKENGELYEICLEVKAIKAKIGNAITVFPLLSKPVDSRSFIGL